MEKFYNVEVSNKVTCKKQLTTLENLLKQIKKKPYILETYNFKIITEDVKRFQFEAWVHPKNGGDDRCCVYTIVAKSKEGAEVILMEQLKKKSVLIGDYRFIKEL